MIPSLFRDGRIYLTASHILLLIIAVAFYGLARSPMQILIGISAAIVTEAWFHRFFPKYPSASYFDRGFSAVAEAAGLLILLQSDAVWFFGVASVITVASKYLLVRSDKSHIFNPTNIAIVTCLALFPFSWFGIWPDEYNRSIYPMIHIAFFGTLAIVRANTWRVTLTYALSILLLSLPLSNGLWHEYLYWAGPEFGPRGFIFIFLMITDPKTAPQSARAQIVYGLSIAAAELLLRWNEIVFSKFIALFIVTALFLLYEIGAEYGLLSPLRRRVPLGK